MNRPRRTSTRTSLNLETLDERIAPAHLGLAALHAQVAEHRAAILERLEARHQARLQHSHHANQVTSAFRYAPSSQAAHANAPAMSSQHRFQRAALGVNATLRASTASAASLVANPNSVSAPTTSLAPVVPIAPPSPTAGSTTDLPTSLPANAGNVLNTIYQEYLDFAKNGGTGTFVSSWSPYVVIQGTDVRVDVHGDGSGNFGSLVSDLQNMGMQITATDSVTQTVEGMLPIAQLPSAAQDPQTMSISPSYRMILM